MFIRPKQGVLVRDPQSKELLPPEGRNVEPSGFWVRRLAEGSVEAVTTTAETDQPAPKKDSRK